MAMVIGVDPHKASLSIEARDSTTERLVATDRFGVDTQGYRQLTAVARKWPQRIWAVDGTAGTGPPLAQRLVARRGDGAGRAGEAGFQGKAG